MNQNWILCNKQLPKEGQWVIGVINYNQNNYNAPKKDIVCIVKGISDTKRKLLEKQNDERAYHFCFGDEWGNNKVPYKWKTFGPQTYLGQEIIAWMPLS